MIRGMVIAQTQNGLAYLEPRVSVSVAGRDQVFRAEEAIVDTAFNGWLTLPDAVIRHLGLVHYGQRPANQADGEVQTYDIYGALVSWHERILPIPVHRSGSMPLIGMALLHGCRLSVEAWECGDVVIEQALTGVNS